MGCCVSKGEALYIDVPREVSSTDEWTLRQKSFLDGCKLLPYTAACPSSYPYQCLTRVVLGDGHLFAALWEGKGGSQAARHCVAACYDLVLERLKAGDEPSAALQKAFQQMDEAYLASDLPDLVKASVGATGTMMLLDTRTNRCHMARLGKAMPFATTTKGSFSTATVEVKDLIPFSNNARSRQSSFTTPNSSIPQQQQQPQDQQRWDPVSSGVTHAIGIGCGKREHLRKAWLQHQEQQRQGSGAGGSAAERKGRLQKVPRISSECEVYVSQLSTADENLVIAAEGLCQVSPPRQIATLLQHFSAGTLNDTKHALCAIKEQQLELLAHQQQQGVSEAAAKGASRTTKGGRTVASKRKGAGADAVEQQHDQLAELSTPTNVASIVVHQALGKSLERFNRAMLREQQQQEVQQQQQSAVHGSQHGRQHGRGQPGAAYDAPEGLVELSYEELASLPLHVDVNAFTTGKGLTGPVQLPDWYPEGGLSKADVHGDMGVVVIALNWPRPPDALRGAPAVTPLRPGPRALRRRPEAEWRWMLLRLHVKAQQAYRRDLRKAWWQLVDDVQAAAETAARQAEVLAWKTKGAAVKVNLTGAVVDSETPANFLRAHTTPSSAGRHPYRQSAAAAAASGRRSGGGGSPSTQGLSEPVASNGGHYSSSGFSTAVTAGPQQVLPNSLPDVAARSQRSTGGGIRGGVVAAAVAAINSQSPCDSPRSGPLSHRSTTSSSFRAEATAAAAPGRRGGLYVSTVQTEMPVDMMPDTVQDLDSPTKALDSPNKFAAGKAWATPPGHKAAARGGGGDIALSPSPSIASSHRASPGPGGPAGAANSAYSHRSLSLRSNSRAAAAAAKPTSPAAGASDAWKGTPSRQPGTCVTAGVTGRRPTSGGAAGQSGRSSGGTPGSAKTYDLRVAARKPAARW